MKKCSTCKVEKHFEEFSKNKSRKDGYQDDCKSCVKQYNKQYREENKDKISQQQKQYKKENKNKISEKNKKYKKENKGKVLSWKEKSRAQKLQATPNWLTVEHLKSIERFYTISKEMELSSGVKYHVDHIIPLQGETVCGLHVPWNLQTLEVSENLSKNNKLLDQGQEFYH